MLQDEVWLLLLPLILVPSWFSFQIPSRRPSRVWKEINGNFKRKPDEKWSLTGLEIHWTCQVSRQKSFEIKNSKIKSDLKLNYFQLSLFKLLDFWIFVNGLNFQKNLKISSFSTLWRLWNMKNHYFLKFKKFHHKLVHKQHQKFGFPFDLYLSLSVDAFSVTDSSSLFSRFEDFCKSAILASLWDNCQDSITLNMHKLCITISPLYWVTHFRDTKTVTNIERAESWRHQVVSPRLQFWLSWSVGNNGW